MAVGTLIREREPVKASRTLSETVLNAARQRMYSSRTPAERDFWLDYIRQGNADPDVGKLKTASLAKLNELRLDRFLSQFDE